MILLDLDLMLTYPTLPTCHEILLITSWSKTWKSICYFLLAILINGIFSPASHDFIKISNLLCCVSSLLALITHQIVGFFAEGGSDLKNAQAFLLAFNLASNDLLSFISSCSNDAFFVFFLSILAKAFFPAGWTSPDLLSAAYRFRLTALQWLFSCRGVKRTE